MGSNAIVSLKAALLVTLTLVSGCSLFASKGPSEVARGEYYSAGKPEFDSFFIVLHEKQVELLAAPQEPRGAKNSPNLGLAPDASERPEGALAQELQKLAGLGYACGSTGRPRLHARASATLFASDTSSATPLRAALPQKPRAWFAHATRCSRASSSSKS